MDSIDGIDHTDEFDYDFNGEGDGPNFEGLNNTVKFNHGQEMKMLNLNLGIEYAINKDGSIKLLSASLLSNK